MRKIAIVLTLTCLAVTGAAMAASNADLEKQISAKLVDTFGEEGKSIRVAVSDGKAVLLGRVSERSTQELAEQVALYFGGIRSVDNQIESSKKKNFFEGHLLGEGEDAKLEATVKSAIEKEVGKYADKIEVEAVDGVVSVRGSVPDKERLKYARDAAANAKGVKKLVNLLRVK